MKKEKTTFYIFRHGETELNEIGRRQGRQDYPLTARARVRAEILADECADINFAAFFASSLIRSIETATIIKTEQRKIPLIIEDLLLERFFGKYEVPGHSSEFNRKIDILKHLDADERFRHKIEENIESDEELAQRMETFLAAYALSERTFGVVAHAGIMRAFLLKQGFASWQQLGPGAIANLGFFVIETDGIEHIITQSAGIVLGSR